MVAFGMLAMTFTLTLLKETIVPDLDRLRPGKLLRNYLEVGTNTRSSQPPSS